MRRSVALTLGFLALSVVSAQGQTIGLSVFGGGYFPVGDVLEAELFQARLVTEVGHEPSVSVGGRLSVRLSKLGVEAEAVYAPSSVDLPQAVEAESNLADASVFLGSLNVTYDIFQAPFSPIAIYLSGGLGIVSRSGNFYDLFEDTTDPAGAVGLGLRFGLGPLAQLRIDLRDYISSFKPTRGDVERESKLQNDLIGTVGLEFTFSPMP